MNLYSGVASESPYNLEQIRVFNLHIPLAGIHFANEWCVDENILRVDNFFILDEICLKKFGHIKERNCASNYELN
jgi:hypothetical protein